MSVTRRELFSMFPVALVPAILLAEESAGQEMREESGAREMPGKFAARETLEESAGQENAMPSAVYPFEKLPVRATNVAQFRDVLKGKLATGESLEVHETTLPPGGAPHPPHHHAHSEMWLIREGTVELTINGKSQQLGPGSAGFAHSNDEHGIKNAGTTPATYFVVAVGPGAS